MTKKALIQTQTQNTDNEQYFKKPYVKQQTSRKYSTASTARSKPHNFIFIPVKILLFCHIIWNALKDYIVSICIFLSNQLDISVIRMLVKENMSEKFESTRDCGILRTNIPNV